MTILRRSFCGALAGAAAATTVAPAFAQAPGRPYRIGVLFIGAPQRPNEPPGPFKLELERLGLVEGVNLVTDVRFAAGDPTRLEALAADLVATKPDLIFIASGTAGTRAAKKATSTIPIVFSAIGDPVGAGLVESLARPGGNLTGGAIPLTLDMKRAQILLQVIGTTAPLFVVTPPISDARKAAYRQALATSGMTPGASLQFRELARIEDLVPVFEEIARQRRAGVVVGMSPMTSVHPQEVASTALRLRLPAIADGLPMVEAGLLMSYSADWQELDRNAARIVHRIYKGAKPGDIPIEQVSKFDFVVNLKTAKTLGVRIPDSVLLTAGRVIE